jgi:glycosyltransferase involved in cell wall biosynthesis
MRIGIDVRYLSHGLVGGVHTYVKHFVPALLDLAQKHQIFLYADTKHAFEITSLPPGAILRSLPWNSPVSSVYLDFFMRRQMARDNLQVVHFPANYGFGPPRARTIITLHDALNVLPLRETLLRGALRGHVKTARTAAMVTYLHYCSTAAVRRADLVLTVSQHARREIAHHGGIDASRIVPIPHAPTPDLRRIDDPAVLAAVRQRYAIEGSFVLADALKNPAVLVRAWDRLPAELLQGRKILFFSRRSDVLPVVRAAVAAGRAQLVLQPPRSDLIALYSMAEVFVFPSWIEGFGLPVLEAMTCGTPVIASNRGSIPEVAGGAALLADAEDDKAFAAYLSAVLHQPQLAQRLRELGFARVAQFSWAQTARAILDAYEAVGAARPVAMANSESHVEGGRLT